MEVENCDIFEDPCGNCTLCKALRRRIRRKRQRIRSKNLNRLRKRAHRKKATVRKLYGDTCYLGCGRLGTTIDHVIPVSRGGTNDIENLRPCCYDCNMRKGSKLLEELEGLRKVI